MDQSTQSSEGGIVPPPLPVAPKRRWGKIILYTIGGLVLVAGFIVTLPYTLTLIYKDGPPPDDSDLRLSVVNVLDEENAYFDLVKLKDVVIYDNEAVAVLVMKKPWDDKAAEAEVASNTQAFAVFATAASKPKFQDPYFADPSKIDPRRLLLPSAFSLTHASRESAFKALYLARHGWDKEAMEAALTPVRVGQKIQDSQDSNFQYPIAVSMKRLGLIAAQQILASSTLSNSDLQEYIQELDQYSKNEDGLISAFKVDYYNLIKDIDNLNTLSLTSNEKVTPSFFFEPNNTKTLYAEGMRALIEQTKGQCGSAVVFPYFWPSSAIEMYTTRNSSGKRSSSIYIAVYSKSKTKCIDNVLVVGTQTLLAMKTYKNDMGQLPPTLEALVPKYLSSVPIDPYGGKPLKYFPEKKIIYSIGSDMQDSGGSVGDYLQEMADPTIVINF